MPKTILHLTLTGHWYDKIASGEKTREYRECKPYWNKRFTGSEQILDTADMAPYRKPVDCKYTHVIFHRGYTATTMEFEIKGLNRIRFMPNDLNSNLCWELELGKRQ